MTINRHNSALDEVFEKLNWEHKSIIINGQRLNNLISADDVVNMSYNHNSIWQMLTDPNMVRKSGFNIQLKQKKVMTNEAK